MQDGPCLFDFAAARRADPPTSVEAAASIEPARVSRMRERIYAKMVRIESGCWLWSGSRNKDGYGSIFSGRVVRRAGRSMLAHRASWEAHRGPVPHGMQVLHDCDVPACVNPDHLFLGTHRDNMRDMIAKGRAVHQSGSANANARLNEVAVTNLLMEFDTGMPTRDIARSFGVTKATVWKIVHGYSWTHVSGLRRTNRSGRTAIVWAANVVSSATGGGLSPFTAAQPLSTQTRTTGRLRARPSSETAPFVNKGRF